MEKLIPKLRFPEFTGYWEKKKVSDFTYSSAFGPRFSSDLYSKTGNVITLRTTDINEDGVIDYNGAPLANLNIIQLKEHLLNLNDLIISRSGTIGITAIYEGYKMPVIPGAFLIRFRLDTNKVTPIFIKLLFNSQKGRNKIESLSAGGVQKNLTGTSVLQLEIYKPTLPEQQKIASFLSAVDDKLTKLQKKKDRLEQYKKGVMQKLFSQEIRFNDENNDAFPDWEVKKLGEIANITTGSSNRQDSILDGEFTFFDRSQDIRTSNRFLFDKEAIIVPGEGQEFIPKYFKGKFDLHQRTYAIMDFSGASGIFLYYSISFNTNHLHSQAVGSTVKSLRLPMFETMPINLPSIPEQTKIADFLSAIDTKIALCGKEIDRMEVWKKGLLQKMFV